MVADALINVRSRDRRVKRLHLVWFLGGYQPRGWLDPRWGAGYDFRRPELYTDCARALERGCFDGVLFADQQAIDDTYTGGISAALRSGYEGLCGDPLVLLGFMGAVTTRIGLAATLSTTFHPPFLLARQLNALDHLTGGRAGWNVVTSARPGDGDNYGRPLPPHDLRYDMADEYLDLCHALWRSWQPDAVLLDRERGLFADPDKVHEVNFEGQWYRCRGPLPMCASPQVSPLLFQAGGSPRGREFAARHAEAILSNQNSTRGMKEFVEDIQRRAQKHGRRPRVLFSIQPVIGETPEAAQEKDRALRALAHTPAYFDGGLARASTSLGIDLARLDMDTPVRDQLHKVDRGEKGDSILFQYFKARPDTTPRDMGLTEAIKITLPVVGTAEQVADRLCEIVDETGADGFLIREAFLPSYVNDIVDGVVPALQRRGRMRSEYRGKTFREHICEE
jgi:FMN-dependent oxidoreductase (nitrilotriacetate monooxygenase family)